MGGLIEFLCSPKVGLVLLGPVLAVLLLKGCAEMESKPRPRRG